MTITLKSALKEALGEVPYTAELYWLLRQKDQPIRTRYSLKGLQANLGMICDQTRPFAQAAPAGIRVLIFTTLHYWIENAAVMGMALAGLGHKVTLAYYPYGEWQNPAYRFDVRRQNIYTQRILEQARPLLDSTSFYPPTAEPASIPPEIKDAVEQVSLFDSQYTLQVEDVDPQNPVYRLRLERNLTAARAALRWMKANQPELVIVPNGTIQEMGVVYRVARYLGIPTVTYEFGEQRDRIWLAQNAEIMQQETDPLWSARQEQTLTPEQMERMKALYAARSKGAMWENFARRWQGIPPQGGEQIRASLGLDRRPIVLLATNVLGDSLTLGRQVISRTMTDWIIPTVKMLASRPDLQVVVRVHPGEAITRGPSLLEAIQKALPETPAHFRLVGPREKVNTYDLIEVADVGLVYTTTVGLEMAMNGVPVIVAGRTHYRGRGFTYDPQSWEDYEQMLGQLLVNPAAHSLTHEQIGRAWHYYYRFFFEFPRPYPWHIKGIWDDLQERPMQMVLGKEGQAKYGDTFRFLLGQTLEWEKL